MKQSAEEQTEKYPPITVRNFTPEEMELVDRAATKDGRTRASWIRDRLNKAAKAETKGS